MKTREALGCQTNFKLRRYEIGPETLNPCRAEAIKIKVRYDEALIALVHLVLFTWLWVSPTSLTPLLIGIIDR